MLEMLKLDTKFLERLTQANKYLAYQQKRLDRAISEKNEKLYWTIAKALMTRSVSMHVCFLNKAAKG